MIGWVTRVQVVWTGLLVAGLLGVAIVGASAQTRPSGSGAEDKTVAAAETLIGKALFLRGFYLQNTLDYDAAGKVSGVPKGGDWTLAAVNVLKVERRSAAEIELDGVRVAIRYNADAHEFQRHPLNDEKMRLVVK